jgi:PilZ domain
MAPRAPASPAAGTAFLSDKKQARSQETARRLVPGATNRSTSDLPMPILHGVWDTNGAPGGGAAVELADRMAERLLAESACELQTETGEAVEVWLISADGATVIGSAPRLAVRAGMELEWRTQFEGQPIIATFVIDEAAYRSARRAHIRLTATGVRIEAKRRRYDRRGLAAPATLTAITCDRIVDQDWISATVVDLSDTGVGLTTSDDRPRQGDRFRLDLRLLQNRLQADVRVARISRDVQGRSYLGCTILAETLQDKAQLPRLLQRLDAAAH